MNFLQIILIIYFALAFIVLLTYIPKIRCWIYGFKKQKKLFNPTKNKIALLIPAKNESECIGWLLDSINAQSYPKDHFDVFIVVDNENDPTINIAKQKLKDFEYVVEPNQKCKADALDSLIKHILATKGNVYDAYIVVDADTYLDKQFVEEMNNALITNSDVVICKKRVKNWQLKNKKYRTLYANLSGLTFTALDTMGNKYKSDHGYALTISGLGMMLSNRYIEKFKGFPFKSLCEDVEVGINAMLNDFKQLYYEYAIIYSEEPITHKEYNKRRYRWLKGYFENNQKYHKKLMQKTFKQGKVVKSNLKYLFELVPVYCFIGLTAATCLTFIISSIVLAVLHSPLTKQALLFSLLMLLLIYAVIALFNLINIIEEDEKKLTLLEKLKIVFFGPIITFEYVIVLLKTINKHYKVNWDHIERIKFDEEN